MDMYNCLKMPTSRFRKILASLFLFAALCVSAQAATYTWVGGTVAADGKQYWSEPNNWKTDTENPATTAPGTNDIVYIRSNAIIDIGSSVVTIDGLSLGNNGLSDNFNVEIKGSGTLTVTGSHIFTDHGANDNGIVTFRPTNAVDDTSKVSNLKLNCNVISPSLAIHSGGNVTIAEGKIARITNVTNMADSANTPTTITVDGFLAAETITLADFDNQKLSISSTGFVSAKTVNKNDGTIVGTVYTQTDLTQNVWLGRIDASWTNPFNWSLGKVPVAADKLKISASATNAPVISTDVTIADTANLTVDTDADITIGSGGSLTLSTGDFDIHKINNTSEGTLVFSGVFTHESSQYRAPNLVIQCDGNLTVSKNLECKSISVAGTTTLDSTSGQAYLVSTDSAGISFGGDVTVNASGNQFVLGGNVSSTGDVNINIESGMLNHVEETTSHNKTWGTNLTADLKADSTTFGMAQGSSYQTKVEAGSGDVYFVGNGTIAYIDDSSAGCNIHFGNNDAAQSNTFIFASDIAFNTTGNIVLDASCIELTGSGALSGINGFVNQSGKLNSIDVDISLATGASVSSSGN